MTHECRVTFGQHEKMQNVIARGSAVRHIQLRTSCSRCSKASSTTLVQAAETIIRAFF